MIRFTQHLTFQAQDNNHFQDHNVNTALQEVQELKTSITNQNEISEIIS
jgi:hypothetical protein